MWEKDLYNFVGNLKVSISSLEDRKRSSLKSYLPILMILMMMLFMNLDLVASCLAKGIKESAYWEATQNVFTFSFSGLNSLLLL